MSLGSDAAPIPQGPPRGRFQDYCPPERRRYVLIAAILASAMGFIDGSVVAIAIPAVRESLDASLPDAQWVNNAYMLTLSALMLVGGALGDRYGLRRSFAVGIALFVAASMVCAAAWSPAVLIAARTLQGIGAAIMVPGSLAIISKTYPRAERSRAIGVWASFSALTTALGPVLGGALLSLGNPELWRLIFVVNLPLGGLAVYLLIAHVPDDRPRDSARLDWQGACLATLGLGLFAWALTGAEGEGGLPSSSHIAAFGLAAILLLALFLFVEARSPHPMMPLRLFALPEFSAANLVTFLLYFALSTILFYLPMTLISGWNLTEAQAGLLFVPLSAAIAVGSGPVGRLASRFGPGPLIGAGCAIVAASYASLGLGMGLESFWAHVLPSMCLMGAGMALVVAPLSAAVMGAVDDADAGSASGINNAVSRMAGLVAVAAMGGVAAAAYSAAGGPAGFGAPGAGGANHVEATNAAFSAVAFIVAAMCAVAALLAFARLPSGSAPSE